MKKLLLLFLAGMALVSVASAVTREGHPRIALVLSGGIPVRGFCEIGVIRALEEEKIPISYVAGTSMGAIIGSQFALGYDSYEIARGIKQIDVAGVFYKQIDYDKLFLDRKEGFRRYLFTFELDGLTPVIPQSIATPQNVTPVFAEIGITAMNIRDFNKFTIPFRLNAVDQDTGEEVIFSSGYFPKVLQASCAMPLLFPPVMIGGRTYVDGGVRKNLSLDLVSEFDPDIIIAVNVPAGMTRVRGREESETIVSNLSRHLTMPQKEIEESNRRRAHIFIEPDISAYSFTDFGKFDEVVEAGYRDAFLHMPALKKLIQQKRRELGLAEPPEAPPSAPAATIRSIRLVGNTIYRRGLFSNVLSAPVERTGLSRFIPTPAPEGGLLEVISSAAGDPYDPQMAERDRRLLRNIYFFDGYKLVRVGKEFDPQSGELVFRVHEGRIGSVDFVGAEYLSEDFLRDKIERIEVFDIRRVHDNIERLYATGLFAEVSFAVTPRGDEYVLTYLLTEKHYNSLSIGLRYDTYEHFSALAALTFTHFKDRKLRQTLSLKLGNEYDVELVSEFWPEALGRSWLGELSLYYRLRHQGVYNGLNPGFDYLSRGVRLGSRTSVAAIGQVAYGLDLVSVTSTVPNIFTPLLPDENIAAWFLRTRIDHRDDPFVPTRGVLAGAEYRQGVPFQGEKNDFGQGLVNIDIYSPLPWEHVVFVRNQLCLGRGSVPLSQRCRLGGEANLLGFNRDEFVNKHMYACRFGYRFPFEVPAYGLVKRAYLSLLHDVGVGADQLSDLNQQRLMSGTGVQLEFNTFLSLAARFNMGFARGAPQAFLAVGNEF